MALRQRRPLRQGFLRDREGPGLNPAPVGESLAWKLVEDSMEAKGVQRTPSETEPQSLVRELRLDIWSVVGLPQNRSPSCLPLVLVSFALQRCLLPLLGNIYSIWGLDICRCFSRAAGGLPSRCGHQCLPGLDFSLFFSPAPAPSAGPWKGLMAWWSCSMGCPL